MSARAQSETVGVVLLVGVFAVAAITIGVLVIGNVADDAESQPRVDLNVTVTPDNVTLTHGGGDTVDIADVEIVVRNGNESRYDLSGFDERRGDGDDRFDPGERVRRDHDQGAGDRRIIVVHVPSNSVLADVTRTARTPEPPDAPLTNAEPTPRIAYVPADPTPGEAIAFDAGTSSDPDGTIDRYDWDWTDDGSYDASGETATHTYDSPGNYTVRLRVVDNGSATNTTTRTVRVVVSQPPTANVTYAPDSPGSGESITFDGSASSDPDGSITGYRWDWTSDGSYEASGETATHTYSDPGRYDVTLEVTDDDGLTATETRTVVVNSPPTARFGRSCTGLDCSFDASDSTDDGSIANYTWQFGDGTTGSGETTSHTYPDHGTYDVTLTVTDAFGAADSRTRSVTPENPPPTASLSATPSTATTVDAVTLDASGSTDDGSIVSYNVSLGDGRTINGSGPTVEYTYDCAGTYDATVTVTDDDGTSDTATTTVTVTTADRQPTVAINAGGGATTSCEGVDYAADSGQYVTSGGSEYQNNGLDVVGTPDDALYNTERYDSDSPLTYAFPLGDGTYRVTLKFAEIYFGPVADGQRVFDVAVEGTTLVDNLDLNAAVGPATRYDVQYNASVTDGTLDVTLGREIENPKLSAILVERVDAPPTANVTYSPSTPTAGETVSFDGTESTDDRSVDSYEWAFGDGTIASGSTPTHTYDSAGSYDVTLTVTDSAGYTNTTTRTVSVAEGTPPTVTDPTLVDATDGNATVSDGDTIRVEATVSDDDSGVDTVTADASAFDAGTVSMTDPDSDGIYTGTATVGSNATEGDQSVTVTATDTAGNTATGTTGTLTVDTTPPTIETFDVTDDGSVSFFIAQYWDEQYDIAWSVTDQRLQSTSVTVVRDGTSSATYTDSSGTRTYSPGFFTDIFSGPEGISYTIRVEAEDTAGNTVCREVGDPSDGTDPADSEYSSC